MASTYLTRTPSSSGNRKTFTFSFWINRKGVGSSTFIYNQYNASDNDNNSALYIDGGDSLVFWDYTSPDYNMNLTTNRKFRDPSGWYHIVASVDTTQATASDRVKIYVNGVQETSFSGETYPSQNRDLFVNENKAQQIGVFRFVSTNLNFFNGLMSHVHFIDGTAYDASAFGEYDANGVWKIKTDVSVTYGTNGFFILKDGNSVTDQSGNGNNFTVAGGTLTNTEDSPSNVFATLNPLDTNPYGTEVSYSNGNLTTTVGAGNNWTNRYSFSTLAASQGKWYVECKVGNVGTANQFYVGVIKNRQTATINTSLGGIANGYGYYANSGNIINNGTDLSTSGASYTTGDIIGIALDLDNGTLDFYKNGTAQGDQVTGLDTTADWQFSGNAYQDATWNWNFGNGYFGTTAVASAGTNASGIGIFEFDVPTGYTALSTKGLNL